MQYVLQKLITHEDKYFIHKTLGFLCLTNYFVQYYFYLLRGRYYLNLYTIFPHILLHASSYIFSVLKKRPRESKMNMFIWEELRIHSLLFAWRACYCILFPKYTDCICLLTMIFADIATSYYGESNISTVRGQHDKVGYRSLLKEATGAFFSISQFGATYICLYGSPMLIFSTLLPIQTSAFGMTLIRKNLITKTTWSIVYSAELLMTYYIWYREYNNVYIFLISTVLYAIRRLKISKYILWFGVYVINFILSQIHSGVFTLTDVV